MKLALSTTMESQLQEAAERSGLEPADLARYAIARFLGTLRGPSEDPRQRTNSSPRISSPPMSESPRKDPPSHPEGPSESPGGAPHVGALAGVVSPGEGEEAGKEKTKAKQKPRKTSLEPSEDFLAFRAAWPTRDPKKRNDWKQALSAWQRLERGKVLPPLATVLVCLETFLPIWATDDQAFRPAPSAWLGKERWLDDSFRALPTNGTPIPGQEGIPVAKPSRRLERVKADHNATQNLRLALQASIDRRFIRGDPYWEVLLEEIWSTSTKPTVERMFEMAREVDPGLIGEEEVC